MSHLAPCPQCLRHVRVDASTCPFCEGALALDATPPALPTRRLGRAAMVAFGTVVATAAAAACGNGRPPADGASAASSTSGDGTGSTTATTTAEPTQTATATTVVPNNKPYGAPPADGLLV